MLGEHGRGVTRTVFTRPVLALSRLGVTPNILTVTGTVISLSITFATIPFGHFYVGIPLITLAILADSMDGILARATNQVSVFGAFLDSSMDRLVDAGVFGSVALWALWHLPAGPLQTWIIALAIACVALGASVSYVRARGEAVGANPKHGLAERTDRLITIGVFALLSQALTMPLLVAIGLGVVAAASAFTVAQRIGIVYRQLTDKENVGGPAA